MQKTLATLSRNDRNTLNATAREFKSDIEVVRTLIKATEPPVERAERLLRVVKRWLFIAPDVISAEELAAGPAKGSFGDGGKADAAKLGVVGDSHFVFQSLLFALCPCQPGEGQGDDGVLLINVVGDDSKSTQTSARERRMSMMTQSAPGRAAAALRRQVDAFEATLGQTTQLVRNRPVATAGAALLSTSPPNGATGSKATVASAALAATVAERVAELQQWTEARTEQNYTGHKLWSQMSTVIVRRAISELSSTCRLRSALPQAPPDTGNSPGKTRQRAGSVIGKKRQ